MWLSLVAALALPARPARAGQPRDWMFNVKPDGPKALIDYFGTGAQLSLEHTLSFYGKANTLTTRTSALLAFALSELSASADLRVLFLSFGGTVGYRSVWRHLGFEEGDNGDYCRACDREARRSQDPIFGNTGSTDRFPWVEGHARLYAPFNDYVVLVSLLATRFDGRDDLSYDWFFTNIHDGGWHQRWETTLFFKHRDWGAIAPYLQMMALPRNGERDAEWAIGLNAVTRPGFVRRDDLLFLTVLVRPDDPYYGQHSYYLPLRALLVYRMQLSL